MGAPPPTLIFPTRTWCVFFLGLIDMMIFSGLKRDYTLHDHGCVFLAVDFVSITALLNSYRVSFAPVFVSQQQLYALL